MILQHNGRRQGNQRVTVDLLPGGANAAHTVHIRIKYQTQVSTAVQHHFGGGINSAFVLRVWNMIGEHAVRLQKLTAAYIGTQRRQHLIGVKSAYTVTGIHHNVQTLQRAVAILHAVHNLPAQKGGIIVHKGQHHRCIVGTCRHFRVISQLQNGAYILPFQTAAGSKELQPISVKGVMGRGDFQRRLHRLIFYNTHKHRGGRCQSAVKYPAPAGTKGRHSRRCNAWGRNAAVLPYGNAKGIHLLFTAVPLIETHADFLHRLVCQLHTVLRRFYRRTAHICAAFQMQEFFFIHHQSIPPTAYFRMLL